MPVAFTLTPSRIVKYYAPDYLSRLEAKKQKPRKICSNKRRTNDLSIAGSKKLKQASQNLIFLSKKRAIKVDGKVHCNNFRAAFITLKLPSKQLHPHSLIIKSCLNQFLVQMRKYYGIKNYVWRAELQQNGNIHFHIIVDRFVHYMAIRKYWNQSIEKLGYVSAYRNCRSGMDFETYHSWRIREGSADKKINKKAYDYGVETQWGSPNSTDVKFIDNDKKAASYISKYMSKRDRSEGVASVYEPKKNQGSRIVNEFLSEEKTIVFDFEIKEKAIYSDSKQELTGRLWYCSQSLSRLKNLTTGWNAKLYRIFRWLSETKKSKKYEGDFFSCIFFNLMDFGGNFRHEIKKLLLRNAWLYSYPFPVKFADVYYHS